MRCSVNILIFLFCMCAFVSGQQSEEGKPESDKPKGRKPLVVLKQASIEGQVLLISDKDGKQLPASDVNIQVKDIDTKATLYEITTDKDGKYTLPNFDIGK